MRRGERKYSERDAEIVRLRLAGHALRHIADDFGLSVERVRQIALRPEREAQRDAWRALWNTTEPDELLTIDRFVAEEEKSWGYDWHIREWRLQDGKRIGEQLRIRLLTQYRPGNA